MAVQHAQGRLPVAGLELPAHLRVGDIPGRHAEVQDRASHLRAGPLTARARGLHRPLPGAGLPGAHVPHQAASLPPVRAGREPRLLPHGHFGGRPGLHAG